MGIFSKLDALEAAQAPQVPVAPEAPAGNSFTQGLRQGLTSAGGSLRALAGGVGEALGADDFAKAQYAKAAEAEQLAATQAPAISQWQQVRDSPDLATGMRNAGSYMAGLAGGAAPFMAVGAGAAAATGGAALPAFLASTAAIAPVEIGGALQRQQHDPAALANNSAGMRLGTAALEGVGRAGAMMAIPQMMGGRMFGSAAGKVVNTGAADAIKLAALEGVGGNALAGAGAEKLSVTAENYLNPNRDASGDHDRYVDAAVGGATLGVPFAGMGIAGHFAHAKPQKGVPVPGLEHEQVAAKPVDPAPVPAAPEAAAKPTMMEGFKSMFTRGDDTAEKMAAGGDAVDINALKAATPEQQGEMLKTADAQREPTTRKWMDELMAGDALSPENRAALGEAAKDLTSRASQATVAGIKVATDAGEKALKGATEFYKAISTKRQERKDGPVAIEDGKTLDGGTKWADEGIKFSRMSAGAEDAIHRAVAPHIAARFPDLLRTEPGRKAVTGTLHRAMEDMQRTGKLDADMADHLHNWFGDDTPSVLADLHDKVLGTETKTKTETFADGQLTDDTPARKKLYSGSSPERNAFTAVVGALEQTPSERYFAAVNDLTANMGDTGKLADKVRAALKPELQEGATPEMIAGAVKALREHASGNYLTGLSPSEATFRSKQAMDGLREHFGGNLNKLVDVFAKDAKAKEKANAEMLENTDAVTTRAQLDEGGFEDTPEAGVTKDNDTYYYGGGKDKERPTFVPSEKAHLRDNGAGTNPDASKTYNDTFNIKMKSLQENRRTVIANLVEKANRETDPVERDFQIKYAGDNAERIMHQRATDHATKVMQDFGEEVANGTDTVAPGSQAARLLREARAKHPDMNVSAVPAEVYARENNWGKKQLMDATNGKPEDHVIIKAEGIKREGVTDSEVNRMKLDTKKHGESKSRIDTEEGTILDAVKIMSSLAQHEKLPYNDTDAISPFHRLARQFKEAIGNVSSYLGESVEVPKYTVVTYRGGKAITWGELQKLARVKAEPGEAGRNTERAEAITQIREGRNVDKAKETLDRLDDEHSQRIMEANDPQDVLPDAANARPETLKMDKSIRDDYAARQKIPELARKLGKARQMMQDELAIFGPRKGDATEIRRQAGMLENHVDQLRKELDVDQRGLFHDTHAEVEALAKRAEAMRAAADVLVANGRVALTMKERAAIKSYLKTEGEYTGEMYKSDKLRDSNFRRDKENRSLSEAPLDRNIHEAEKEYGKNGKGETDELASRFKPAENMEAGKETNLLHADNFFTPRHATDASGKVAQYDRFGAPDNGLTRDTISAIENRVQQFEIGKSAAARAVGERGRALVELVKSGQMKLQDAALLASIIKDKSGSSRAEQINELAAKYKDVVAKPKKPDAFTSRVLGEGDLAPTIKAIKDSNDPVAVRRAIDALAEHADKPRAAEVLAAANERITALIEKDPTVAYGLQLGKPKASMRPGEPSRVPSSEANMKVSSDLLESLRSKFAPDMRIHLVEDMDLAANGDVRQHSDGHFQVRVRPFKTEFERADVIAHEFGHALQTHIFDTASDSVKVKIRGEYDALVAKYAEDAGALTGKDYAGDFLNLSTVLDMLRSPDKSSASGMISLMDKLGEKAGQKNYAMDFDEYFANQFAKYMSAGVETAPVETRGFWQSAMAKMKQFYADVIAKTKPGVEFKAWVDSLVTNTSHIPEDIRAFIHETRIGSYDIDGTIEGLRSMSREEIVESIGEMRQSLEAFRSVKYPNENIAKFTKALEDLAARADKETKLSMQRTNAGVTSTSTVHTDIKAHIDKVLGKTVDTEFAAMLHAGEFVPAGTRTPAGMANDLIRISTHSLDPMGTAYHESLHGFMKKLGDAGLDANPLFKAAMGEHVMGQLRKLLASEPEALKQLSDPHEAAAYMYQFWEQNKLNLFGKQKSMIEKVGDFFKKVLGMWTNDQRAEHIMEYFGSGEYAKNMGDRNAVSRVLALNSTPELALQRRLGQFKHLVGPLDTLAQRVAFTGDAQVRGFNNPVLTGLLDKVYSPMQGAHKDVGYAPAARAKRTQIMNDLTNDLAGYPDAVVGDAMKAMQRGEKGTTPAERQVVLRVRKMLDGMRTYMADESGVNIGDLGPTYFPRQWDTNKVLANEPAFRAMLQQYKDAGKFGGSIDQVFATLTRTDGGELQTETVKPGMQFSRERVLAFIRGADAQPFLHDNMFRTLDSYVTQGTRRAEWSKRFGDDGKQLDELFTAAALAGATPEQISTTMNYLKAVDGTLGDHIDPKLRRAFGNAIVYQNIRILPMMIFSSLIDSGGIMVRGGTVSEAFKTLKRGFTEMPDGFRDAANRKGKNDPMTMLAETMGVIDSAVLMHTIGSSYTQGMTSDIGRTINDKLFKYNLAEQYNRSMRVGATEAAVGFLGRHADGTESAHSTRWLAELGLKPGQVKKDAQGRPLLTRDQFKQAGLNDADAGLLADRMTLAVNKWVDGAVLRPNAAHKPMWMSDPHFALIAHLKQFVYSFQETILKRVVNESKHGNFGPAYSLAAYVPFMLAADLAKGALLNGGSQPAGRQGWDAKDYAWYEMQRAGLFGVGQFAIDVGKDIHRGGMGFGALTGPSLEQLGDAASTIGGTQQFKTFAMNSMPANQVLGAVESASTNSVD